MLMACFGNNLPVEAVAELRFYPISSEGARVLEAQVMSSPASITCLQSTGNRGVCVCTLLWVIRI